jgi:hypothetical protein
MALEVADDHRFFGPGLDLRLLGRLASKGWSISSESAASSAGKASLIFP